MMHKSFNYSDFVRGIISRGKSVLLIREKKKGRMKWNFPGGKIEDGESVEAALFREIKEEIGVNCSHPSLFFSDRFVFDQKEWNGWYFQCLTNDSDFNLDDGIYEAKFVDVSDIDSLNHNIPEVIIRKLLCKFGFTGIDKVYT